jgi:hypothetical protein
MIPHEISARLRKAYLCDTLSRLEWTLCRTLRRLPPSADSALLT